MNLDDLVKAARHMTDEELEEKLEQIRKSRVVRGVKKRKKTQTLEEAKKMEYFDPNLLILNEDGEEIELEL